MGGRPLMALNLVMFPSDKLEISVLRDILRGGSDKVTEAGATLAGGHSVDDDEPKYGLAVTGIVHPDRILTNSGAREGDLLVLTKPIGTGVLFNASRSGKLPYAELETILPRIAALNRTAVDLALEYEIHACTDVTGFGIIGHLMEISEESNVQISISFNSLPVYPNSIDMYRKGETTRSNKANRKMAAGLLEIEKGLSPEEEELLFDPQTSGGLLLSLPPEQAEELTEKLKSSGMERASIIGTVVSSGKPGITVT